MTHFDRYRKPVVVLLDMVSVALDQLGEVVGSLAHKGANHCRCTGRTVVPVMGLME
jgi:hypothetical protein